MIKRTKLPPLLALIMVMAFFAGIIFCGCTPAKEEAPDNDTGPGREEEANDTESEEEEEEEEDTEDPATLTYYGHSTFKLETARSTILMEPYQPSFGTYGRLEMNVDAVTITHEHSDHNYASAGGNDAVVLRGLSSGGQWNEVDRRLDDTRIYSVAGTLHGRGLGNNSIFVYETPHLRVVHLGDLGHTLDSDIINQIGRVDVLLIPVGGYYTLESREVLDVISQLSPAVAIPMHYRTSHNSDTPIGTLDDFLQLKISCPVNSKGNTLQLTSRELPAETEIWTMSYVTP